ncbi:unnamed protein product [Phaedon cochleariae]|uniref:FAM192A/Fyv6 N-terminal domain-containing protein n=1 Tax=Phaedon cochleariae TaxID=80249 RepID=A0A9N9SFT1_PHACE|nr:unnamed protein product [Phaedon cochleariae]
MSSGFITESEAAEIRKTRQEEWEKVRKPSDPLVRPEEQYDNRSLFEKLQDQKQKRDLEYEEAHKLKNMIKGLDDDEIEFLDLVDRTKIEANRKKELEEEKELHDYRNQVSILQEKSIDERLQTDIVVAKRKIHTNNVNSQQKLLKGVVIKKNENKKRKVNEGDESSQAMDNKTEDKKNEPNPGDTMMPSNATIECVAILPGLGFYKDSSSEDNSSESEEESCPVARRDLCGRKIEIVKSHSDEKK